MLINEIIAAIEAYAPRDFQETWDNSGVQVGTTAGECTGVLLCVDVTPRVVDEAVALGANLIISHHPLIFKGIKHLTGATPVEASIMNAIAAGVTIYSSHTAMDNTPGGVSYEMAQRLGVTVTSALSPMAPRWVKLTTMVPTADAQQVRAALFDACGGEIGNAPNFGAQNYDCCSFNVEGIGTFRANDGTDPTVGDIGNLHHEKEVMITMLVRKPYLNRVIATLKQVHPYQTPAYEITELLNPVTSMGLGVVGTLDTPLTPGELITRVKQAFGSPIVRHTHLDPDTKIYRVAMCGGAGGEFIPTAISARAQAYITSDTRYHDFVDHQDDILIIDIGHFESEQVTKDIFYHIITQKFANFAVYKSSVEKNSINYT